MEAWRYVEVIAQGLSGIMPLVCAIPLTKFNFRREQLQSVWPHIGRHIGPRPVHRNDQPVTLT